MTNNRICKQMPVSVLAQPPTRSFLDQYSTIPSKGGQSAKVIETKENEWERTKS